MIEEIKQAKNFGIYIAVFSLLFNVYNDLEQYDLLLEKISRLEQFINDSTNDMLKVKILILKSLVHANKFEVEHATQNLAKAREIIAEKDLDFLKKEFEESLEIIKRILAYYNSATIVSKIVNENEDLDPSQINKKRTKKIIKEYLQMISHANF